MILRKLLQRFTRGGAPAGNPNQSMHSRNVGADLLDWPERARQAVDLATKHLPLQGVHVADYGCGRQTLRLIIPSTWGYAPYDYCSRSEDTMICDFNKTELPGENYDAIFCMGVLEYLDRPLDLLSHAVRKASWVLFSYNGFTTEERRRLQGWKNNLSFEEFEQFLAGLKATVLEKKHLGNNEWVYLVKGKYETCSIDSSCQR